MRRVSVIPVLAILTVLVTAVAAAAVGGTRSDEQPVTALIQPTAAEAADVAQPPRDRAGEHTEARSDAADRSEAPRPAPDRDGPRPSTEASNADEPRERARPTTQSAPERVEPLRLACGSVADADGRPAVGCRWSEARHPDFASYQLWRADREEGQRSVVFATDDRSHTWHVDRDVEAGHMYVYMVVAVDTDGAVLARSEPVWVPVGEPVSDHPTVLVAPRR